MALKPLAPGRTNVVLVTASTTSWSPANGGETSLNDTLIVIHAPLHLSLRWQATALELDWTGAGPPYTIQQATALTAPDWTDLLRAATPPVTLSSPPADGSRFYRVVGH